MLAVVKIDGGIGEVHTVDRTATAGAMGGTRALVDDVNTDRHIIRVGYVFEKVFYFWPTFRVWYLSHQQDTDFVAQNYYPYSGQSKKVRSRIWGWQSR